MITEKLVETKILTAPNMIGQYASLLLFLPPHMSVNHFLLYNKFLSLII